MVKTAWPSKILKFLGFERNIQGDNWYLSDGSANWSDMSKRMDIVRKHPVLLPIFNLYSTYISSINFTVDDDSSHPLVDLINNPNQYQTKEDFLKLFTWYYLGFGYVYQLVKSPVGFSQKIDSASLYNLRSDLIEFGTNFQTPIGAKKNDFKKTGFTYDQSRENLSLTFKDVLRYHDLPTLENYAVSPSRLDSHKEAISNIKQAFEAKNVIIGSNGRELFRNQSGANSFPFVEDEKKDVERKLIQGYGMTKGKRRGIVTNANVIWQSLHIPLKELGLDDSVIKDATILLNANSVPAELISYADKQPKYENREMAEVGFIQRVIQPIADDLAKTIGGRFDVELKASFTHLPVMQRLEKVRIDKLNAYVSLLNNAVQGSLYTQEEAIRKLKDYEETC